MFLPNFLKKVWVRGIYYSHREKISSPPLPLNFVEILPCAVIRAYIKPGNKIRIVSLFFIPISHSSYLFPLLFLFLFSFHLLLPQNSSLFLNICQKSPPPPGQGGKLPECISMVWVKLFDVRDFSKSFRSITKYEWSKTCINVNV